MVTIITTVTMVTAAEAMVVEAGEEEEEVNHNIPLSLRMTFPPKCVRHLIN